jgi:hypothetical protein
LGKKDVVSDEMQKVKQDLLTKAKADGKIEQKDIFLAIPDTAENLDVLDSLYTDLAEANIAITAGDEPAGVEVADEWAVEDGEEEIVLEEKVYLDDIADDSVRLYLRWSVKLL